ncbi:DUF928 domain-containing protein [Pseudanabaena galeata UHCC 0370]|uniref:DUF928 domain-containing protein n=1 Tax=Pseudanabaena galeata UHCC 0370 TaxID=3110310 RepID=A0ABU5TDI0_9CYAN|nr:DUF928 domain-containing protein [Pseudanabaena galeata]MEA5476103.1 DUF928 domain-containing protein [Pseudanabaena galeata UHCC 0370]
MISTKTQIKTNIKKAIALSAICIASVASPTLLGHEAFAQYGLGLPKSASSGGATRGDLPLITILGLEDGAKTLASRPTLYWYIAPQNTATTSSTTVPPIDSGKSSFKVTFFLRDGYERSAKPVFVAEGKAEESGLYKFTLPENAPELMKGKAQRWQIRWQSNGGAAQVDVYASIRRDDEPLVLKAIVSAKNDLEKARIYAKNAYWYDALDAYTSWLSKNPQDNTALTERSNLVKAGLNNNSVFMKRDAQGKLILPAELDPTKLSNFLTKLDESKSAASILLQPKIGTRPSL